MGLYGVAIAIVGRDPECPHLVCSCVRAIHGGEVVPIGVSAPDFSQQLPARAPAQVSTALKKLVSTVCSVVDLQAQAAVRMPVPIVIGVDARMRYPLDVLLKCLADAFGDYCTSRGIRIAEVLDNVEVSLGDFGAELCYPDGRVNKYPSKEDLVQWYLREEPEMIDGFAAMNELLSRHESGIRLGQVPSISLGVGVAYLYGLYNLQKMLRAGVDPCGNFALYLPCDERLRAIPLYHFLRWHPQLMHAFRSAVQLLMPRKNAVIIKTAADAGSPPFVDVVKCRIEDQQAGVQAPSYAVAVDFLASWKSGMLSML
jgi:hypothetical protein